MVNIRRSLKTAFLAAVLWWPLLGCNVIVPPSDRTIPQVRLLVFGLRAEPIAVESAMTLTVPPGTDLHLLATGIDRDGGVQSVGIYGAVTKQCSAGGIGVAQYWHPTATFHAGPTVGVGSTAKNQRFVALLVPSSTYYTCSSGSLDSTEGLYRAVAGNFHGGTATSPPLTLRAP